MNKTIALMLSCALTLVLVSAVGCSKKAVEAPPPPPDQEEPVRTTPEPVITTTPEPEPERVALEDVFFDFDRAELRSDARDILTANAQMLQRHPETSILIEGHCDERGTNEYNLALGDRRAQTARDFFVRYGIDATRIETISYGEERPFAMGHTENAWALNRRAHFVIR